MKVRPGHRRHGNKKCSMTSGRTPRDYISVNMKQLAKTTRLARDEIINSLRSRPSAAHFARIIIITLMLVWYSTELRCTRSLLGVQGAIFNLKPIAKKLLVPEQTLTQIEKFWKDEDKQLEIVLEEWKGKTDKKQNHHNLSEILETLKHEGM